MPRLTRHLSVNALAGPLFSGASTSTGRAIPEQSKRLPVDDGRRAGLAMASRAEAASRPSTRSTLPTAPSDAEKYAYLQPQRRSVVAVQTLVSVATSGVLTWFFLQHVLLVPFVVVTAINIAYALVSFATGIRRRRVNLEHHLLKVAVWRPERHPSIDVFLPSAGEPLDVLDNTYAHVAALDWPGVVKVLVLDDSARSDVRLLARRYGFVYHARPDRGRMKKAGNLLYGFDRSENDLIVVFDADFCPRPDFLSELVPYFDDVEVGIVQSPQYFDSHGEMNWLQSAAGAVQEIFYRWVQPARDAADGAICVGTCALYRRSALVLSGGFAQIGHSEDVHTGVNLMKAGFRTRYVPVNVSAGLCPDNLQGFLSQQYRWCAGSMSLLRDTTFHAAPMTLAQRACFFTGFLYYISTGVTLFGGPLAAMVLVWFLPEEIWPYIYLPLVAASWLVFAAWKSLLTGRWNLSVVRVQMFYSAAHALAIWHSIMGRTASWVPTGSAKEGKNGVPLSTKISRLCLGWLVLAETALVVGVTRGALQFGLERFWLSIVLTGLAVGIVAPMLRAPGMQRAGVRPVADRLRAFKVSLGAALAAVAVLPVAIVLF